MALGMRHACGGFGVGVIVGLLGVLGAAGVAGAAVVGCTNEARRVEQAALFLPDCRAYELVSPPGDSPLTGTGKTHGAQASAFGDEIAWYSYYPPPGLQAGGQTYLSRRTPNGWVSEGTVPPQSPSSGEIFECYPSMFYSPSLAAGVLSDGFESDGLAHKAMPFCSHNEPGLVQEPTGWQSEPEGFQNLFRRDNATGSYMQVNRTPNGVAPANAFVQAGSTVLGSEFSHVVFEEEAQLVAGAPVGVEDLYEWSEGTVRLVSVLPDGTSAAGHLANRGTSEGVNSTAQFTHAVSSDGSRIVFVAGGRLYMRVNAEQEQSAVDGGECLEPAKACTVQIDASQVGGAGGGGTFLWASANDTRVFFTDTAAAKLTSDTNKGAGNYLYEYQLPAGAVKGLLKDLTPSEEAMVDGVSGVSESGDTVYFVADARLPGTTAPTTGNCSVPMTAEELADGATHECNLYVLRDGHMAYIAVVETAPAEEPRGEGGHDWGGDAAEMPGLTARVSTNGRFIAFNAKSGGLPEEVWRYDANAGEAPVCVSCARAGVESEARLQPPESIENEGNGPDYLNRNVLDNGDVFFDTETALVPEDTDGVSNVYEYSEEAPHLISTGVSPDGSYFVDASGEGKGGEGIDVFFETTQTLVKSDTGSGIKLYDARVDGGFVEPAGASECDGEECRAVGGGGETTGSPASAMFSGPENAASPPAPAKRAVKSKPSATRCRTRVSSGRGRCGKHTDKKAKKLAKAHRQGRKR